jgi:hypothetical protein
MSRRAQEDARYRTIPIIATAMSMVRNLFIDDAPINFSGLGEVAEDLGGLDRLKVLIVPIVYVVVNGVKELHGWAAIMLRVEWHLEVFGCGDF